MANITNKDIDKKIATFTTNRDKLRNLGHEIALMIFRHAAPEEVGTGCVGTGDCTRALKLIQALPGSWAIQMADWFKAYSPVRVVEKNGKCEFDPKYKALETRAEKLEWWNLEGAEATPFWELTAEVREVKTYDFNALVEMITRQAKAIKKKIKDGVVAPEDVPSAEALVTQLEALHFKRVKAAVAAETSNDGAVIDLRGTPVGVAA